MARDPIEFVKLIIGEQAVALAAMRAQLEVRDEEIVRLTAELAATQAVPGVPSR